MQSLLVKLDVRSQLAALALAVEHGARATGGPGSTGAHSS
jgi:hypothetical protein